MGSRRCHNYLCVDVRHAQFRFDDHGHYSERGEGETAVGDAFPTLVQHPSLPEPIPDVRPIPPVMMMGHGMVVGVRNRRKTRGVGAVGIARGVGGHFETAPSTGFWAERSSSGRSKSHEGHFAVLSRRTGGGIHGLDISKANRRPTAAN